MTQASNLTQALLQPGSISSILATHANTVHSIERHAEVGFIVKCRDCSALLIKIMEDTLELYEGTWELVPPTRSNPDLPNWPNGLDMVKHTVVLENAA